MRKCGWIAALVAGLWLSGPVAAQDLSALARVDSASSQIVDGRRGAVEVTLALTQAVPFRVFTLDAPRRLVVDFREIDWSGLNLSDLVDSAQIGSARAGGYRPGLSRMVLGLNAPMKVATAGMAVSEETGAGTLSIILTESDEKAFAAAAGAPSDPRWDLPAPAVLEPSRVRKDGDPLTVVVDPGHGGIDPGAEHGALSEKDLMLTFARELREALLRADGFDVVLTRDGDYFVSLERRVAIAHEAKADVFLSLHADSLSEGMAHGATVYVLSDDASDVASALLAQRHDRDEILSGVDLSAADDEVTDILLDLARQETQPRNEALAQALVAQLKETGAPINRRPIRLAAFSVLKAADIPSVLLELGFLSSPRDLSNLRDDAWRKKMVQGIRAGLEDWARADAARRSLVRQ